MKKNVFKRFCGLICAAVVAVLVVLFFTNDFGLVDLRKTSVIIGVGVDFEEDDRLTLTAQLAVPMPAENGENTQFAVVTGKGYSVAEALNDVNVKTGFYPKLVFCKLIIIGESCFDKDVNASLNYFFVNEYSGLTPKIAAYDGKAEELFSMQLPYGDSVTDSLDRLLSDEAQKSANVSTVNLNDFGQGYFSKSRAAYMPFIELKKTQGEVSASSLSGDGGDNSSQGKRSGGEDEFYCGRTAVFTGGKSVGILSKEEAFALNLLNGNIRRTYISFFNAYGNAITVSVRNCKGGASLKIENGVPVLKLSFSAAAKLQDDKTLQGTQRSETGASNQTLRGGEEEIIADIKSLYESCKGFGCDVFGVQDMLYKKYNGQYEKLSGGLADNLVVVYDVVLRSVA